MKYYLLIYWNTAQTPQYTPEQQRAVAQAWQDYTAEAKAAGVYLSNDGLRPVTDATTVRVRNGKTLITDGPFAETHEQFGGYFFLNCKDLDEALAWAAKLAGLASVSDYGSIEVRPNWQAKG
jgi:hypothetical protein